MKIAFIGCGFVADFYMQTLKYYPHLELVTVFDRNPKRLKQFSNYYNINYAKNIDEILLNDEIKLVLNLTNPREHFNIIKKCLLKGKNVYSEKPLAMDYEEAKYLYQLAKKNKLKLVSAPSSVLSLTAQTIRSALEKKTIGDVKLVYANFDAGMTHKMKLTKWKSVSGALWPALDEFETGCTYQHAGYFLTWLFEYFGEAYKVTSFAKCIFPEKGVGVKISTPDFSVGCIEYKKVIAKVTLSVVAPLDRSLTIIGDKGVLYVPDIRNDQSPVYVKNIPPNKFESALEYRVNHFKLKLENLINWFPWSWGAQFRLYKKYPFINQISNKSSGRFKPVDFCNGPSELVMSINENRECRLSSRMALNVNEIIEVLQYPDRFKGSKTLLSPFVK